MPIYAYRCTTCGHAQDVLRRMSDPALTECPHCGAPTFVKQVTAAGFQLKGSGWYVTDFKGDKKPADRPKDGDDKGAVNDGADASKGDAGKPEPAADGKDKSKDKTKDQSKDKDKPLAAPERPAKPGPVPAPTPAAKPAPPPSSSSGDK